MQQLSQLNWAWLTADATEWWCATYWENSLHLFMCFCNLHFSTLLQEVPFEIKFTEQFPVITKVELYHHFSMNERLIQHNKKKKRNFIHFHLDLTLLFILYINTITLSLHYYYYYYDQWRLCGAETREEPWRW